MPELVTLENCRQNYMADTYCEIAMEALYKADSLFKKIKCGNYSAMTFEYVQEMEKQVITSVVFSAMCIESFLNNFAAMELGDDEFYDNFDKLSTISKFQLISKFILKVEIDKGEAYYSYLKKLMRNRDSYVHNKSKNLEICVYEESESEDFFEHWMEHIEEEQHEFKIEINSDYQQAVDGMKAVRDIAIFFIKNTEKTRRYIRYLNQLL